MCGFDHGHDGHGRATVSRRSKASSDDRRRHERTDAVVHRDQSVRRNGAESVPHGMETSLATGHHVVNPAEGMRLT